MDLKSTIDYLNHYLEEDERRPITFAVEVFRPGSIGGTPCVEIKRIRAGFDWDQGKMLLTPAQPLTTLTPEDVEAIRQDIKKAQSPAGYQAYKHNKEQRDGDTLLLTRVLAEAADHLSPELRADIEKRIPGFANKGPIPAR